MPSERRAARRLAQPPKTGSIPDRLAAGPCIEVWADPVAAYPTFSAWRNWQDAREAWLREHDLMDGDRPDWHRIPRELRCRAPFSQDTHRKVAT